MSHCATRGARHEISQRRPFTSVLHVLVPLRVEFVTVVLPTPELSELVTLLEVLEVTELLEFTALVELVTLDASTVCAACVEGMFPPGPHADSASASAVIRYLMGMRSYVEEQVPAALGMPMGPQVQFARARSDAAQSAASLSTTS